MQSVMAVLPMAFVMVAGPQIVAAILLTTSLRPRRNSAFFLLGAAVATSFGVTAAHLLTGLLRKGAHPGESPALEHAIDLAIIALLLFLGARVFLERKSTAAPRWMSRLESATPSFAWKTGFLLFLLMPGDIVSMATVGAYLARHDVAAWHLVFFVALTVALTGIPLAILLLLGERGKALLPRARDWMERKSWIVSEVMIAFFLVMTVRGLFGR
jgi:hypothetical protein